MRAIVRLAGVIVAVAGVLQAASAFGQGTAADYERAAGLREKYQSAVVGVPDAANWIEETSRFWYRRTVKGGAEFVLVDAETQEKRPAFDHERLAAALAAMSGQKLTSVTLPFNTFTFTEKEKAIEARVDGAAYTCTLADYTCTRRELTGQWDPRQEIRAPCTPPTPREKPSRSPDGKREAFVSNYNVVVREAGAPAWTRLSTDGSEGNCYELDSIRWSPDSAKLAAFRVKPGYRRLVHYVESSPEDQLQPKHSTRVYAKPGDVLDVERPVLFEVGSGRQIEVDDRLFPNAYDVTTPAWRKDSSAVTFEYNQRGHQVYRVIEVEGATGRARAVVSEETPSFFCYSGKKYRFDVADGKEVIWMSERDGWNHLYLYDGTTGAVKNQITKGPWVVRGVSKVDEGGRQIYFSASGMYPGQDPYFVDYYRIGFDGTGLTRLTEGEESHAASFSSDRKYFVDLHSRVDTAPVLDLRLAADGSRVAELERPDLSGLTAAGWRPPEVFTAKGRDGTTDIWGVIYRPANFDPKRKYPVVENIYAGPHGSFVPKTFAAFNAMQATAEIGFIVVQIDGMGTSNRSKAFHDVSWKNIKDAGFPDRILWHKAVAAKYPYYDITRVGIYGTSAGGQNAMAALLFHGDFYDAAFSAAGCHDNRMDKIWWNEQWMGWPIGPEYAASSNVEHAARLKGKLMLVVGEMDSNVDPSSTFQVVNALIKANKTFDLLVIPGAGHTSGGAYGDRKRNDFFVQNLLGAAAPAWNAR